MDRSNASSAELLPANTWHADDSLQRLLGAWLPPEMLTWAAPSLVEMGRAAGDELERWGDTCEHQPAVLRPFDGWGDRVDEVVYPDAWRQLAANAATNGLVALPYERETLARLGANARVVQAALCYLFAPPLPRSCVRSPLRSELLERKRRSCCWLGCTHRKDKELSPSVRWVLSRRSKASA